jgi:hypothetical protein
MFKPTIYAPRGKNKRMRIQYYMSMNVAGSNVILFLHLFNTKGPFGYPFTTIVYILVYQREGTGDYSLIQNRSLASIDHSFVGYWCDIKLILLNIPGRGLEHYVYKLFDILTGRVRRMIIPRDHKCSQLISYHYHPVVGSDKLFVSCLLRRSGLNIQTLFNITWQGDDGILTAEYSWSSFGRRHIVFVISDGNLIETDSSGNTFTYTNHFYPRRTQRYSFPALYGTAYITSHYFKHRMTQVFVYCTRHGLVAAIKMFRITPVSLIPCANKYEFCNEIQVSISIHLHEIHCSRYDPLADGLPVMMGRNGDLFSLVREGKGHENGVFSYIKLFTLGN